MHRPICFAIITTSLSQRKKLADGLHRHGRGWVYQHRPQDHPARPVKQHRQRSPGPLGDSNHDGSSLLHRGTAATFDWQPYPANYGVETDIEAEITPLICIKSGPKKPGATFVEVEYEIHWFWIEAGDFASKRIFTFLKLILMLSETGQGGKLPVLTIPAG